MNRKSISSNILGSFGVNNIITPNELELLIKGGKVQVFNLEGLNKYRKDLFDLSKNAPDNLKDSILEKSQQDFNSIAAFKIKTEEGLKDIFLKAIPEKTTVDNEKENEEDNDNEITEDEYNLLVLINENLSNNNEDESAEDLAEESEPPKTTEEIKSLLQSLQDKGYITFEENNGVCNVTSITDDGKAMLEDEEGSDEEDNDEENSDGGGENDNEENKDNDNSEEDSEEDVKNQNSNKEDENSNDNSDDSSDNNNSGSDNEDNDENKEGQEGEGNDNNQNQGEEEDNKNKGPIDEAQATQFAKETSTEDLQIFIDNPNSAPNLVEIAKKELEQRNGGNNGEENQQGGGQPGDNANSNNGGEEKPEDEEEFKQWMNQHLDDHDIEDLRAYTKKLILQSPGKLKELKEHYRGDFTKNNGGNRLDKIDQEQFDEWLDQYLSHLPLGDLKDYASKLIAKNPKEFTNLKKQFGELKENNML